MLDDCPSLLDFERLARAYMAARAGVSLDGVPITSASPSVVSDGVNVSSEIPAERLKGANAWAWRLISLRAARDLIHAVERNGQMFVHRSAVEFHLTRSQKLVRKADGRLAVNERLFAP